MSTWRSTNTYRSTLLVLLTVFVCALPTVSRAEPADLPVELLEDAELTDIHFLDPDRGFAVGDRGVIWRTENGGRNWRLVPSPLPYRWESVFFSDENNGWIVGGRVQPLLHQSVGAVLRTRDGGRTWQAVPKLLIPALKQVHFNDAKSGWAVGQISDFFPSGIFRSDDGGQTWTPASGIAPVGWHSGSLQRNNRGVVVGTEGQVAVVAGQTITPAQLPAIGPRGVRQVAFLDERHGWLAGDGGLVLTTINGGVTWTIPRSEIPSTIRDNMDFRALAVRGPHCWLAGAPGTLVLHSRDSGQTWELQKTEHIAPLTALHFIDEMRGWGVGVFGAILATRDGGQSWTVQRQGGGRAALLSLCSEPQRVPLEVIARLAGNDGYLAATEILTRGEVDLPRSIVVPTEERIQSATSVLGACACDTAWRFPVRQRELPLSAAAIVDLWNRANGGQGVELLEAHVVKKVRQWRPEVIITERSSARGDDPLAHITNQIVLAAVAKAADPQSYPEQIETLGLAPWKPRKVLSALPPETNGTINLSTAQLAPRLGGSLADVAATSRGLLYESYQTPAQQLGFQLVINTLPEDLASRDFMSGIVVTPGSDARRNLSETSPATLDTLRREAPRSRNIQVLLARSVAESSGGSWLGQVDNLTRGLSKQSAGRTMFELGWRYQHSNQSASAADAFQLLLQRYPEHDLADAAALWLVQYYASGETGARLRRGTRAFSADTGLPLRQAAFQEEVGAEEKPIIQVRSELSTAAPGLTALDRAHQANDLAKQIATTRPQLFAQPQLRFSMASAQRQMGFVREVENSLAVIAQQRGQDVWWNCAEMEAWLTQPKRTSPKIMTDCAKVQEKPTLDGVLDDGIWRDRQPLELRSQGADGALPPAHAWIVHDGEYLYVAVKCAKVRGVNYSEPQKKRRHDMDLSASDRVELHIDLDRDYASYYSLAFDYRGFTQDVCFGDVSWDPVWYVASTRNEHEWIVEAAIPLPELKTRPPQSREMWAIGLQRIIPGVDLQSWNQPAAVKVLPAGFGVLRFE